LISSGKEFSMVRSMISDDMVVWGRRKVGVFEEVRG
jgi:hypothetical protein